MKYYKIYFFVIGFLTFGACDSNVTNDKKNVQEVEESSSLEVKKIAPRVKMNTNLSKEVKQLAEENTNFHDLQIQIEKLNSISVKSFSKEIVTIQENCTEFEKTIPEIFKGKSVFSRIDAIQNFSKAIAFEQKKNSNDTTKLHKYSYGLVESYNSLIVQLGDRKNVLPETVKKSLKETINIKKDSLEVEPLF